MILTTEQIKEAIERFKPDGIESPGETTIFFEDHLYCDIKLMTDVYYDCFLDRGIQGVNRNIKDFMIIAHAKSIELIYMKKDKEAYKIWRNNGTTEEIREARENAIVFVLEELSK